jgi:hypothetical protein
MLGQPHDEAIGRDGLSKRTSLPHFLGSSSNYAFKRFLFLFGYAHEDIAEHMISVFPVNLTLDNPSRSFALSGFARNPPEYFLKE